MAVNARDDWDLQEGSVPEVSLQDAREHDLFWAHEHARENYFRRGLDYEDYAPAYCVGYVGHAQYGGDYEEAEKSLLSNWVRIKGDSRLSLDEAQLAMRSAWERAAGRVAQAVPARQAVRPARESMRRRLRRIGHQAAAWTLELEQRLARGSEGLARH
jgi:hypothetical protein